MPRTSWQTRIDELRQDNRSGSAEIAYHALELMIETIGDSTPSGPMTYRQWLLGEGRSRP